MTTRRKNVFRTAGSACVWPSGLEAMYGVSSETRRRWERAGLLPARDFYLAGKAVAWRPETIAAATSGNLAA